jgi:DNA-binding MarR family transcriptional regulator
LSERTERDAVSTIVDQWTRERPDLDPAPINIFGRVHRVFLRYQEVAAEGFRNHGVTPGSFDVLAALRRSGPPFEMNSSELAAGFLLSPGGMSLRLDRLEEDGLIERHRDAHDRRIVFARLTEEGLARTDRIIETHLKNIGKLLTGLSESERTHLGTLLAALEASMAVTSDATWSR